LGAQQLINMSHNILPLVYFLNWGYLLLHWEFIWKNNIVHGLSFVGSFNLTCNFAVVCGALQNYANIHSPVIWKRKCLSPPDSTPEHALMYCPGPTFLYKFWGGTRFICKRRLVNVWTSGPSWKTFSSCPVWATQHGWRSWEVGGCCVLNLLLSIAT
jgi:hypothetical protein